MGTNAIVALRNLSYLSCSMFPLWCWLALHVHAVRPGLEPKELASQVEQPSPEKKKVEKWEREGLEAVPNLREGHSRFEDACSFWDAHEVKSSMKCRCPETITEKVPATLTQPCLVMREIIE